MAFLIRLTTYWSILLKQVKENLGMKKLLYFFLPQFWQRQFRSFIYFFLSRKTSQGHEKFNSIVRYGLNVEKKNLANESCLDSIQDLEYISS